MLLGPPGLISSLRKVPTIPREPPSHMARKNITSFFTKLSCPRSDVLPWDTAQEQQQINRCRDPGLKVCSSRPEKMTMQHLHTAPISAHSEEGLGFFSAKRLETSETTDLCLISPSCLFSQYQPEVRFPGSSSVWALQLLEDNSVIWKPCNLYED